MCTNNLIMELMRTHNRVVGVDALQSCEPGSTGQIYLNLSISVLGEAHGTSLSLYEASGVLLSDDAPRGLLSVIQPERRCSVGLVSSVLHLCFTNQSSVLFSSKVLKIFGLGTNVAFKSAREDMRQPKD
ncbi:hypothetical protein Bca101_008706 [Brassica carinata]